MAVINGNAVGIYVGGQLIGCLTGCTYNSQREEIPVTCKDDNGNKSVILGGLTGTADFTGNWNPASTYGLEDLLNLHYNGTEVSLGFGDQTNLTVYSQAYLPQITWEGPLNAASTFSGSFALNGTPTLTTT